MSDYKYLTDDGFTGESGEDLHGPSDYLEQLYELYNDPEVVSDIEMLETMYLEEDDLIVFESG